MRFHPAYYIRGEEPEHEGPIGYDVGYDVGADVDDIGAGAEEMLTSPYVSGDGAILLEGDGDTLDIGAARGRRVLVPRRAHHAMARPHVSPFVAAEAARARRRVEVAAKRTEDTPTQIGIQQALTANQTLTFAVTPADPFTPDAFDVDALIAPLIDIVSIAVGRTLVFGATGNVRATAFAKDRPIRVGWPGFSQNRPLLITVTNLDANPRLFVATLHGVSHQSAA